MMPIEILMVSTILLIGIGIVLLSLGVLVWDSTSTALIIWGAGLLITSACAAKVINDIISIYETTKKTQILKVRLIDNIPIVIDNNKVIQMKFDCNVNDNDEVIKTYYPSRYLGWILMEPQPIEYTLKESK